MEKPISRRQSDRLIIFGFLLFLLGLTIGLFVQQMTNARMGLAAHLEGIMNGLFLMVLGLIWPRLKLPLIWLKTAFWLVIYGTFANFAATTIAAITGFGRMMPIAGGVEGVGMLEGLITFLLVSLSLSMLVACMIVIFGFYKSMHQE